MLRLLLICVCATQITNGCSTYWTRESMWARHQGEVHPQIWSRTFHIIDNINQPPDHSGVDVENTLLQRREGKSGRGDNNEDERRVTIQMRNLCMFPKSTIFQLRQAHVLWVPAAPTRLREASQPRAPASRATQAASALTRAPPPPRWRSAAGPWRKSPPLSGSSRTTSTLHATTTTWWWRRRRRLCRGGSRQAAASVRCSSSPSEFDSRFQSCRLYCSDPHQSPSCQILYN